MNKWLASLLSLLALSFTAAGCGGDDEDEDEDGGSARTTEQPADTGADTGAKSSAGAVKVSMRDIQYVPKDVKVKTGGTIRWTNGDSVAHTVTKQGGPGPKFDSGNLDVGATFERKFDTPGKVDYVCTIHPNQTGTVTVE